MSLLYCWLRFSGVCSQFVITKTSSLKWVVDSSLNYIAQMWIFLQNKLLPSTLNIAHVVFPASLLLLLRSRHWTATLKILPLVEFIKFEIFLLTCLRKYSTGLFHGIFVTMEISIPIFSLVRDMCIGQIETVRDFLGPFLCYRPKSGLRHWSPFKTT